MTFHAESIHAVGATEASVTANLRDGVGDAPFDALIFYCSATYDLDVLGPLLNEEFSGRGAVVGCTSAGQISADGFVNGGITALVIRGGLVQVSTHGIHGLSIPATAAAQIADDIAARRAASSQPAAFGLLLVDGLSMAEESLAATLFAHLGEVPFVGGSAGDDLTFTSTKVFVDGRFSADAAVFVLFETALPFKAFKFHHFVPGSDMLVVTRADADKRIVHEINGLPAVEAYAEALGMEIAGVNAAVWSAHPLLVKFAEESFIRSVQGLTADGGFQLLCAMDEGVVLRIGNTVDPVTVARDALTLATAAVGASPVIIGCDCILRRLEFLGSGLAAEVGQLMADQHVFGFSTYGEQWNGLHVNQTFTGVAIGGG